MTTRLRRSRARAISTSCQGQLLDPGAQVDVLQPDPREGCAGPLPAAAPVQQPVRPVLLPEDDVVEDRHRRQQAQLLVDGADASGDRVARAAQVHRLAVEHQRPVVRGGVPGQQAHQRGLPGAVLAEQDVHSARSQLEVDPVEGPYAGEGLGQPPTREDRLGGVHGRQQSFKVLSSGSGSDDGICRLSLHSARTNLAVWALVKLGDWM
jgi:hypothetical protein